MLFPCLFHAIFTRFVLKKLLFISISNKVKENSKKTISGSIRLYQALNIPATTRNKVNHQIEMLKRQIVNQSISLYPTIVSLVQLFLGRL